MMKRSPVLRNAPSINFDDAKPAISNAEPSVSAPAVSQLASRVSGMKGNTIVLPVCGRNVAFTLKVIAAPHRSAHRGRLADVENSAAA